MATLFVQLQLVARFRLLLTMAQSISPTPCIVTFPLFPLHQAHQLVFIREGKKGEMRASLLGKVPSPKLGVRSGSPLPSSLGPQPGLQTTQGAHTTMSASLWEARVSCPLYCVPFRFPHSSSFLPPSSTQGNSDFLAPSLLLFCQALCWEPSCITSFHSHDPKVQNGGWEAWAQINPHPDLSNAKDCFSSLHYCCLVYYWEQSIIQSSVDFFNQRGR